MLSSCVPSLGPFFSSPYRSAPQPRSPFRAGPVHTCLQVLTSLLCALAETDRALGRALPHGPLAAARQLCARDRVQGGEGPGTERIQQLRRDAKLLYMSSTCAHCN